MAISFKENVFINGGAGGNQYGCKYRIAFPRGLPFFPSLPPFFDLRLDEDFIIPSEKNAKQIIYYRGISIPKNIMKEETDKTIKLNFRLDGQWIIYNALKKWKIGWFNTATGSQDNGPLSLRQVIQGEKTLRTDIVFIALTGRNKEAKRFFFRNCAIEDLEETGFKHDDGNPTRCIATLNFSRFDSPTPSTVSRLLG